MQRCAWIVAVDNFSDGDRGKGASVCLPCVLLSPQWWETFCFSTTSACIQVNFFYIWSNYVFFISQTFYISLNIKLIHAQRAYMSMSCVKFKLSLGWNVACGRTGKLIAGSTVVWPRCVLRKCVWEKGFFSHTAGKKRLLFLTLYSVYVAATISTMWKKINPFLFFSVNWNGIWNPFLLQFYVPIEEKETTDTFGANMATSNKSISFPFFLSIRGNWTQTSALRLRSARHVGKGSRRPRAGPLQVWARLA